ncbi:MAG: TadE/TadG family type IV pilus assembly protein [Terracidiphilus sp.]|jgi:Flp pilus assembly protein TadG
MFCQGNASRLRLKWSWRLAGDQEGGALVEFALTAPMLLAFVFGLIEVCIALYTLQSLSELAREGSRYAIVHGATCTTGSGASCTASASAINTFVSSSNWPNIGGGTVVVAASFPDGNQNPGSRAQVTVTYTIPFKVAFIPTKPITMSSTSVMYIIQ